MWDDMLGMLTNTAAFATTGYALLMLVLQSQVEPVVMLALGF